MRLYRDELPELEAEFRKEAGYSARLSEKAEQWPHEINNELLKQFPFLSDYEMNVNLDRVEAQRGYAFGYADLTNRTERPEVEHEEAGIPHVRIPLIVQERGVRPFTTFLDGDRVLPLTEDRLRDTLFNPATFDLSASEPRDPSLVDALTPPHNTGMGMGGGLFKEGSAKAPASDKMEKRASLLTAIALTLRERDVEEFVEKVASDPTLQAGFRRSGIVPTLIDVFENTKRASADERLTTVAESILPTVMTLQKLPGGDFLVKSASNKAFAGDKEAKGKKVPKEEAAEAIGPENAQAMQPGQVVSAVADPVEPQEPEVSPAKPITEFGQYNVQDTMGNTLTGWVFPETLAWDGNFTPQPVALFTNGSAYAFQDAVAGEMVGMGYKLPVNEPRGDGAFYTIEGGRALCTVPLTIRSAVMVEGQQNFVGVDPFGTEVHVTMQDGLREPMRISDIDYALPSTWKFMRLNNQTELASDAGMVAKVASALQADRVVSLIWNGSFHLDGGCGLDKVASAFRSDLDPVSAEFMLGVLGVESNTAKQKLAQARRNGVVKMAGLKPITTLAERYAVAEKTASALVSQIPNLRRDLTKVAAVVEDTGTVDNLLALNFINPENLNTFVEYLPTLEETSERVAEMLLSSYLGMNQLPEAALERGMKNLEEVITGLKSLQHAEA